MSDKYKVKVSEYKRGNSKRFQLIIPVMFNPLVALDGTKIQRTGSLTVYCVAAGDTLVHAGLGSFGRIVDGKVEVTLPKLIAASHEAYKMYKQPEDTAVLPLAA